MKFRMTKVLKFWVEVEYQHVKNEDVISTRTELISRILGEFEGAGDAMRCLNAHGRISWKPTPSMLTRLADAEKEALDDGED
jgi:hypothetical protein